MEDHALAKAFPAISRSIVRITVSRNDLELGFGSGYLFGGLRLTNRAVVATAAHVLPIRQTDSVSPYRIRIDKFDSDGEVSKRATFDFGSSNDPNGPLVTWDRAPGADVAIIIAPRKDDDGGEFFESSDLTVQPSPDRIGPAPATRVAWAGFPDLLARPEVFGKPQLCYYEGVVACWARHKDRSYQVIDGHALPGVSGGPVWFFNERLGQVRVGGVISHYRGYDLPEHFRPDYSRDSENQRRDRMPGFVFVEPIHDLLEHAMKFGKS